MDGEGARGLIKHQRGDLTQHAPEFLRTGPLVAQPRQVVLHQRVRDDGHAFHRLSGERRRQEIELARLESRGLKPQIQLHDPAFALSK